MPDSNSNPSPKAKPKQGRCPRCGRTFKYGSVAQHPSFPFCSSRCRDIDLGKWISGAYSVPGEPIEPTGEDDFDAT